MTRETHEERLVRQAGPIIADVVASFTYDPGHSDLDDEQPMSVQVRTTLGALRWAMAASRNGAVTGDPDQPDDYTLAIAAYRLVEDLPTLGQVDRAQIKTVLDDFDESRVDEALDSMIRYGAVEERAGMLWPTEQEPDQT